MSTTPHVGWTSTVKPAQNLRAARKQGPSRAQPGPARYSMLPDLSFLNHNKPPPSAASILDPSATNGVMPQTQALREAEAWYVSTVAVLKERLGLAERLRDGLGEVNTLLRSIETLMEGRAGGEDAGWRRVEEVEKISRDLEMAGLNADDGGGRSEVCEDGNEIEVANSEKKGQAVEVAYDKLKIETETITEAEKASVESLSLQDAETVSAADHLRSMEQAVEVWLKDIRVARAKWIAGGRNSEKRIGLR